MSSSLDELLSKTLTEVRDRYVADHNFANPMLQRRILARANGRRVASTAGFMVAAVAVAAAVAAVPGALRESGPAFSSGDSSADFRVDAAGSPERSGGRWGPFDQDRIDRENRETRAYVACMSERGWSLPEPTVWEGPPHPGLLDPPLAVPIDHPKAPDARYYADSNECGVPYYDEDDNLLP